MASRRIELAHPGKILREEFVEPAGPTAHMLARAFSVPLSRVCDIVREERAISAEMAVLLSAQFGTSDADWINLQGYFDVEMAKYRSAGTRPGSALIPTGQTAARNPNEDRVGLAVERRRGLPKVDQRGGRCAVATWFPADSQPLGRLSPALSLILPN